MNKTIGWWIGGILVVAAVAVIGVISYFNSQNNNVSDNTQSQTLGTSTDDLIHVTVPLADVLVQSPLVVKGEARGSWYFEASFPVKVFDSNGKLLGQVAAQAQGDWMTTDFVPFQATLSFDAPTTEAGTVVFQRDNPSGIPANDRSVTIPVYFSNNASKL